jgi:hypothetical protein
MFPRNNKYKYSSCRLILLKLNNGKDMNGGVTYITGNKIVEDRDGHVELKNLELGTYYYYVEFDWQESTEEEFRNFNICSYSCSDVLFEKDMQSEYTKEEFLEIAFKAKAERASEFSDIVVTDYTDEGAPGVKKYTCSKSGEGYNWTLIKNDETDVTLIEDVKYPKFDGLAFVAPYEGDSYKMEVPPGE